ncbi:MAG: hypothetical protein ABUS79_00860 [Pseudomonadota bacterium]
MADEDDLYALPLDQFVAARNALGATLKRNGDADGARRVKALSKPAFAAWVTNQTARRAPDQVAQLLRVTDALADAQRTLGPARDAHDRFQAAAADQRAVLAALISVARGVLAAADHADDGAVLDKVQNNLRWGPLAPEPGAALQAGRLVRDVESPGLSAFGGLTPVSTGGGAAAAPPPAPRAAAPEKPPPSASGRPTPGGDSSGGGGGAGPGPAAREQARAAALATAAEQRERQRLVHTLEGDLRRARADAEHARRELQAHGEAVRKREARARAAENELAAAQADLASVREAEQAAKDALAACEKERIELADRLAAARAPS